MVLLGASSSNWQNPSLQTQLALPVPPRLAFTQGSGPREVESPLTWEAVRESSLCEDCALD